MRWPAVLIYIDGGIFGVWKRGKARNKLRLYLPKIVVVDISRSYLDDSSMDNQDLGLLLGTSILAPGHGVYPTMLVGFRRICG